MKALKIIMILLLAAANFACGSSKTIDSSLDDSKSQLAYCNAISSTKFSGRIKAETPESVEIYFDSNLASALSTSNVLKFYKWSVRPDETMYLNPTALKLVIRDLQTGQVMTGEWQEVSQAMATEYGKTRGLSNLSLQDFLNGKVVVITGIEMEYDALRLLVQSGGSQILSVDTLIPAFAADPNIYAQSHSQILSDLHPNNSVATDGWTAQEFQQRAMSYCF